MKLDPRIKGTHGISNAIRAMEGAMSDDALLMVVQQLVQSIEEMKKKISQNLAKPEDMRILQKLVDAMLEASARMDPVSAKRIACKKGCAACCYQEVRLTNREADYLSEEIMALPDEKILAARDQAQWNEGSWVGRWPKSRCVFLGEDNACTVYSKRPLACRTYQVVDTAARCDLSETELKPQFATVMPAEILVSAMYSLEPSTNIARQVIRVLGEK